MALMLDTWQQTAVYNPADPTQKKIETWAGIPGQMATFYFNRVPNPGTLKGRFRGPTLLGMPRLFSIAGVLTYGAIAAGLVLFGKKTKPGRKVVRKVKGLLPGKR